MYFLWLFGQGNNKYAPQNNIKRYKINPVCCETDQGTKVSLATDFYTEIFSNDNNVN